MEIEALAGLIILVTWLPVGLLSVWLIRKAGFEIRKPRWSYIFCALAGYLGLFGILLVLLVGECFLLSARPEISVIRFDENGKLVW